MSKLVPPEEKKRQADAGVRDGVGDNRDVEHGLQNHLGGQTRRRAARRTYPRPHRNDHAAQKQCQKKQKDAARTDEAEFLTQDREDKVVLRFGHIEVFLPLLPSPSPTAPPEAIAYRLWIVWWPSPSGSANGSSQRRAGLPRRAQDRAETARPPQSPPRRLPRPGKPLEPGTPDEHEHRPDAEDQHGAGQMRFKQHKHRHAAEHKSKRQHAGREGFHPVMIERDDVRKDKHDAELGDFARLQGCQGRAAQSSACSRYTPA